MTINGILKYGYLKKKYSNSQYVPLKYGHLIPKHKPPPDPCLRRSQHSPRWDRFLFHIFFPFLFRPRNLWINIHVSKFPVSLSIHPNIYSLKKKTSVARLKTDTISVTSYFSPKQMTHKNKCKYKILDIFYDVRLNCVT